MRVAFYRLPKQVDPLNVVIPLELKSQSRCAQKKVEGSQINGRPVGRSGGFGGLQSRLDDAGHADRHLVLQLKDLFQGTVEPVSPEMRAGCRVNQLCADAHADASFANGALEDIADSEFAPDLFHIDRLALVGEARIASDHEELGDA